MIRHLVLFKLNDGVERDEPRVVAGDRAFRVLPGPVRLTFHRAGRRGS